MDMRNGDMYPDRASALKAGVPSDQAAEVEQLDNAKIVRVTSGPFKGRIYARTSSGLVRLVEGPKGDLIRDAEGNLAHANHRYVQKTDGSGELVLVREDS